MRLSGVFVIALTFLRLCVWRFFANYKKCVFCFCTFFYFFSFFYVNTILCFLKEILKGVLDSRFFWRFFSFSKNNFFGASAFLRLAFFAISKKRRFLFFVGFSRAFATNNFSHGNVEFRFLKIYRLFFSFFFFVVYLCTL